MSTFLALAAAAIVSQMISGLIAPTIGMAAASGVGFVIWVGTFLSIRNLLVSSRQG